jgi:hypothetical protein
MVGLCAGRASQLFAEAGAKRERSRAKRLQPGVLPDLQGKGTVRQRSISVESLFGYFCGDKSN